MADILGKEIFVQNLNGTSILEVAGIVTYTPLCCLFYFTFYTAVCSNKLIYENWYVFLVENIFLVIPNLLILTTFCDYVWQLNIVQLLSCFILGFSIVHYASKHLYSHHKHANYSKEARDLLDKKLFVSNYRAFMNIATILSILSVDFKVFPRRFAKAEVYGTGFMDIGVGSFIFGHAIISPFARGTMTRTHRGFKSVLVKHFSGCIPILFLGIVRLISVKGANYHEHVTEYGVHWNFFFTLAFVKFFADAMIQIFHAMTERLILVLGISICLCYQFLLSSCGLENFIQNGSVGDGSRNNLIDANREGLTSCIGYTGLFLIASHLGSLIFVKRSKLHLLRELITIDVLLWFITFTSKLCIGDVSRQMANFTYVFWIAVNMVEEYITERLSGPNRVMVPPLTPRKALYHKETGEPQSLKPFYCCKEPLLVKAISRNQLAYFLLGNILTGIVNLTVNTIHSDNFTAMIILIVYILITNGIVVLLHVRNVNTKIW